MGQCLRFEANKLNAGPAVPKPTTAIRSAGIFLGFDWL